MGEKPVLIMHGKRTFVLPVFLRNRLSLAELLKN